ncbi:putative outer membrane protein pmp20 precursor [Gimesia alba]|uniref:Probable pectate lyase C n=1 Tax=Gimesia alba TaxID=2527973 RepID=A0A517RNZ7_9PLAN|nr:right-handed parallel beta-helix repeat-containing protein [Gimesia alba]QDT45552.1 putative outer membrane protein pmp20 precursor [Gimesia alba]
MFASLWLSSLKRQLRPCFLRSARARRNHRHQLPSTQALVTRNAAERLEDRTLLTTFTVVNTDDSGAGSLRDAIEQANASSGADTITFDAGLAGQTIVVSTEMQITNDLTITGLGADQLTLDGNGDSRIFNIDDGHKTSAIDVFLEGLSLTNGYFHSESGSIFEDKGGAIYSSENLTVTHSSFSGNTAREGGAIFHLGAMLTVTQSDFFENEVTASGGAIFNEGGPMTIIECHFSLNRALGNGGGAVHHERTFPWQPEEELVVISNSEFTGNHAKFHGGAFFMRNGVASVSGSQFTENTADFPGGAICNIFGTLSVEESTFLRNATDFSGGAINSNGDLTVRASTFSRNTAKVSGGAIYVQGAGFSIFNSTISRNVAASTGGGIFFAGHSPFLVMNSTIILNESKLSGAGLYQSGAETASITNTIIAGNSTPFFTNTQVAGNFVDNSNIIQESSTGLLDTVLRDNGGPTQTHALLADSPAINAGDNSAILSAGIFTDQRGLGYPRIVGGTVDVGAFEYLGSHLLVDSATDTDDGDYSVGNLSLREAIKLSNDSATTETITFDASLFDQTLMLFNELVITDDVTIIGHGAEHLTLSGDGTRRLFRIDDGDAETSISVDLSEFTLTNGFANVTSGGAIHSLETLSISDVLFTDNQASVFSGPIHGGSYGGAIYSAGDLTVTNSTFVRNSADWYGGAIYSTEGLLSITGCDFTENQTSYSGGAILVQNGDLTVSSSTFTENSSDTLGGGIYIKDGLLTVSDTVFTENSSGTGGAIYHQISSSFSPVLTELSITNCTFQGNTAESRGGALHYLSDVRFYSSYHNAYIEDCLFTENSASSGGSLSFDAENVLVTGSTFFKNSASSYGGAVYSDCRNLTIQNSLFEKNSTNSSGGALYIFRGSLVLQNSTLSGNTALVVGGGITFYQTSGAWEIVNSTLTGNAAARVGGGIYSLPGSMGTISNTIIAGNSASSTPQVIPWFTRVNSIIQDSIEGLLDPVLRDNGGLTKTHALLPGSAAIDGGDDTALENVNLSIINRREATDDQRGTGFERFVGESIDIGAFEVQHPFAQVDLRIVDSKTSTQINGESTSLPDNLTWIDEWSGFWLEIWISTPSTTDLGLLSAAMNLSYNTAITTATSIEYGAAFTVNQTGTINDLTGTIENLSAESNLTDAGDDQRVLFARIRFESTTDDGIDLDLAGQIQISQSPEFKIHNTEILLTGGVTSEEVHGASPDTRVWANPYDLDDNDAVNIRDLVLFINVYNSDPRVSNSDYSWFADLDQNNSVNFRDLVSFIGNYGKSKARQSTINYPQNFPNAWNKHLTVDPVLLPQVDARPVDQADAESVLDGVVEYLEPQLSTEDNEKLAQVNIEVVDLEDGVLSNTVHGTIYVDVNAAGYGWFVDDTPGDNSEFYSSGLLSLTSFPFSDALGKIDLWTVIMHELGHLLGHEHETDGVMQDTLAPSVRRLPDWADEADSFFSDLTEDTDLIAF